MSKILVVCAFSGTGKTEMARQTPGLVDLDSSLFGNQEGWIERYLRALLFRYYHGEAVFASTHPQVVAGLAYAQVPVLLAYPDPSLKAEYEQRYIARAGSGGLMQQDESWFARRMMALWDQAQSDMASAPCTTRIVLQSGQYLSDRIAYSPVSGFVDRSKGVR